MTRRGLTDAVTALAAQTFPPSRRVDGRVVRDCARDAIDAAGMRAMARETVSVAFAGLRVSYGVSVRDVRQAPWRRARLTWAAGPRQTCPARRRSSTPPMSTSARRRCWWCCS